MAQHSARDNSLAMFRFQLFYEDVVAPVTEPNISINNVNSRSIFACGELREAVAIAALAVACDFFPREPFVRMLESGEISRMLAWDLDVRSSDAADEIPLPYPVNELPTGGIALEWSEFDMGDNEISIMPQVVNTYSSLMRQVHRNESQRIFNAELLFSSDYDWQAQLDSLALAARTWSSRGVDVSNSIWLAEGLDSYFDFASDLGVHVDIGELEGSLTFSFPSRLFRNSRFMINPDTSWEIIKTMIRDRSLFPLAAWRFGSVDLAAQVGRRVQDLQRLVDQIISQIDFEKAAPIRVGFRIVPREF